MTTPTTPTPPNRPNPSLPWVQVPSQRVEPSLRLTNPQPANNPPLQQVVPEAPAGMEPWHHAIEAETKHGRRFGWIVAGIVVSVVAFLGIGLSVLVVAATPEPLPGTAAAFDKWANGGGRERAEAVDAAVLAANSTSSMSLFDRCRHLSVVAQRARDYEPFPDDLGQQYWSAGLSYVQTAAADCLASVQYNYDYSRMESARSNLRQASVQWQRFTERLLQIRGIRPPGQ
ncbi:hypothetical protein GCM10023321_72200 [Pseudonocardia eucalypti]|uniref:DUF4129 domain-containing protein n=1 Tax=Pseudonocardia eucalypti TaxID=648755 RepID=A0ABP9R6U1_9PSEU|nr:hypothetical protein [Pseudonocardia eucalypti]